MLVNLSVAGAILCCLIALSTEVRITSDGTSVDERRPAEFVPLVVVICA